MKNLVALVAFPVLLPLSACTKTDEWRFPVVAADGTQIEVTLWHRTGKQIGGGHLTFPIGPLSHKWRVSFDYKGVTHKWEGELMPYILSISPSRPPILGADARDVSALYQATAAEDWKEISPAEFPLDVVVPNLEHVIYSPVPPSAVRAFPKGMGQYYSTSLVYLWQRICNIKREDLPFADRIESECLKTLKGKAEVQWARELGA